MDFRPISLTTSLCKVIAKVLSHHIQGILNETMHWSQGAFVEGMQILDVVLVANEVVDDRRQSRKSEVVFKIDFEKSYDHVNALVEERF